MQDYNHYSTEDFLQDASFRCWVLTPTEELSQYWEKVASENPDITDSIKQSRIMLLTMDRRFNNTAPDVVFKSDIQSIITIAKNKSESKSHFGWIRLYDNWRSLAASVILLIGVGLWLAQKYGMRSEMLVQKNNTETSMSIVLEDSSLVILEKGSILKYPRHFASKDRQVFLEGQAFFEVAKNPDKPFIVFANETVTKVLGTSFTIKAFREDKTVVVSVRTGKVSVSGDYRGQQTLEKTQAKEVLLLPEEQAIFDRKAFGLNKRKLVRSEENEYKGLSMPHFYEDTPVTDILNALEDEYGIDIIFDEKKLKGCLLNTQFADEFLQQKLLIISQAIGARYEISEGHITFESNGCN